MIDFEGLSVHCGEITLEINCPDQYSVVRLWINTDGINDLLSKGTKYKLIVNTVKEIMADDSISNKFKGICDKVVDVNAIQIIDNKFDEDNVKVGFVAYTVGFDNDTRG